MFLEIAKESMGIPLVNEDHLVCTVLRNVLIKGVIKFNFRLNQQNNQFAQKIRTKLKKNDNMKLKAAPLAEILLIPIRIFAVTIK